ncbi:MAG TPA: phosphoglucosamine mutase [Myxococcota bacterium]|nr:phosphoglucosamine mutase [Myxococcota bacterium]
MGSTRQLFGTDGIRGRANVYPMTGEVMMQLGRAVALVFRLGPNGSHAPRVLIGKDTRLSGYMLEDALAAGLCSMGVDVLQVGPIPTPGLAFLTVDMRCDAGAMISASHNPFEDNGVKFFSRDGFKLPDELESRVEELMQSPELEGARALGADLGRARRIDDASGRYIVFLKKSIPRSCTLEGLRIAIDCANGAAYKVAPTVLEELGAEVVAVGNRPDGTNINDGCGATHPEHVAAVTRESRADLGIAVDGDADRVMLIDERGELVDGDQILTLCALDLKRRGALSADAVVGTVMSNLGMERALHAHGIRLVRADVGDRYVVEAMLREKINLGGEQSGHLVFLDHNTTGDGMLSALQVLALMRREERPLSELARVMQRTPQVLKSVRVRTKTPFGEIPEFARALAQAERALAGNGRANVRYSGTEPLARVMIEGDDAARIETLAQELCEVLRKAIGDTRS